MTAQQIEMLCLDNLLSSNHPYRCFKELLPIETLSQVLEVVKKN